MDKDEESLDTNLTLGNFNFDIKNNNQKSHKLKRLSSHYVSHE